MLNADNPFVYCKDYINDRLRVKGLLADYFGMETLKSNLLLMFFDIGIVEEIQRCNVINNTLKKRLKNNAMNQFGISDNNAEWAFMFWIEKYASDILNKTVEIEQEEHALAPTVMPANNNYYPSCTQSPGFEGKVIRDIFKAIFTDKWIEIEYSNKSGNITCYWIGIKQINTINNRIIVDGFNVNTKQLAELNLYISSIISSNIVEGSYYNISESLKCDIEQNAIKYAHFFGDIVNLKLFNYYADCSKLDQVPRKVTYGLIDDLEIETIGPEGARLSSEQFNDIVKKYHIKARYNAPDIEGNNVCLCMNVCSMRIGDDKLYVLAYKDVYLDIVEKTLRRSKDLIVCEEFTVEGMQYSIQSFIGEENMHLIKNFERNLNQIEAILTEQNPNCNGVDDTPYLMAIARDLSYDPEAEYDKILNTINNHTAPEPIKAFLGEMKKKPQRRKNYPLALYNDNVNIDQMRVIHDSIKYPLLYVQGPPGTGKTNTILNTIITAFFNKKSVLVTSYNNHPMDEIYSKLLELTYYDKPVPFPVVRLGNNDKMKSAIQHIKNLYVDTREMQVFKSTLDRKKAGEEEQMVALNNLLKQYEEKKEAEERKDMIETMLTHCDSLRMLSDLQLELNQVNNTLSTLKEISDDDIIPFIDRDRTELLKYIYYISADYIKKIEQEKYKDLRQIIFGNYKSSDEQVYEFNRYLQDEGNFIEFTKLFPVVITTNISAHKLGKPGQQFDMVIMDEASQCNTAMALIPIFRGKQLMLVGDPQQLQPVIVLDSLKNDYLRRKYNISDEYDYVKQSVYKTFLSVDAISEEVLLGYHYRCHPKIIEFNNIKYYNSKLTIKSEITCDEPLVFVDCKNSISNQRNTNTSEVLAILDYVKNNPEKNIGIITPFVNQKHLISKALTENGYYNVSCGTVHAYQGDEKQEIIFSLGLSSRTGKGTYRWLKNNKELINVATSRAKEKLILLCDSKEIIRLHQGEEEDDLFELFEYVKSGGKTFVSEIVPDSRALGVKPYDKEDEDVLLNNLNHVITKIKTSSNKHIVKSNVPAMDVLEPILSGIEEEHRDVNDEIRNLFHYQEFDYVVFEKLKSKEVPVFAIEITNPNTYHPNDIEEKKKDVLCDTIGLQVLRIPNNYARRYIYLKDILTDAFRKI